MKARKVVATALAMGMVLSSTGVVHAAATTHTKTGTTPVTYDNRNFIPDPGNPDMPDWAVTIPSAINFTDDNKTIDASVELVSKNGGAIPTNDVTVTVESANNYKLKEAKSNDEVSYKLIYDGVTMTDVVKDVATLKGPDDTTKAGNAVLGSDKASARGSYEDTLTYTVSHTAP